MILYCNVVKRVMFYHVILLIETIIIHRLRVKSSGFFFACRKTKCNFHNLSNYIYIYTHINNLIMYS